MSAAATQPGPVSAASEEPSLWFWLAMLASLGALAGSLYLSIGLELKACPLCYYQRTFVMGVVAVLIVGLFVKDLRAGAITLLALPLAFGGLGVAGYHEYLVQTGVLECPAGVQFSDQFHLGTAPQQSLAAIGLLTLLLVIDQLRQGGVVGIFATMILGGLLAFGGIMSTSSACPKYENPVDQDMCRPLKKA